MRLSPIITLVLVLAFTHGCVKGNPDAETGFEGGALAITRCGYTVKSRYGAEAPQRSIEAFGDDPTPRLVHLGIAGDPRTSMVTQWRTADDVTRAGVVRYGIGAGLSAEQLTETVTGIQFAYELPGNALVRVHQAHLCGLEAGTTYTYQVGARDPETGVEHFSPIYTFRTAPDVVAHPDAEVVVGVLGDCRDGYDVWEQLTGIIASYDPDLVLFSGDAVTVGITQFEWEAFLARGEPLLARVPLLFANGNHENNAVNFYSQFAMPGDQENFSIDYGFAHITVLNDTPEDINVIAGATVDFMRDDFEASKAARWKLAMHHQAIWSSSNHGSTASLQEHWRPVMEEYKLDLVLNGHDHEFEISKPMVGDVPQASVNDGTVYIVSGGAGAELYSTAPMFHTEYAESTYSASIMRVRRDQLTLDPFRPDGTAIPAAFTKSKP